MRMRGYQDLKVWQSSMDLAVIAYHLTVSYPDDERYGLVSQTRRAAVSVPCNIAEGQRRSQPGEFRNQLSVARGSLQELETLVMLANRLELMNEKKLDYLLQRSDRINRMMPGLRKTRSLLPTVDTPQCGGTGRSAKGRAPAQPG